MLEKPIKQKIFIILKEFAPKKYNAWEMAAALNLEGREKYVTRMCMLLTQNFQMIHMEKIDNNLFWYYKKEEKARDNFVL